MNNTSADTHEDLSRWQKFQRTVVWEYLQVIVVAFVLVFGFIRPFVVEAFKIPSGSMEDTLLIGDRILVCKFMYGIRIPGTDIKLFDFHKPTRGDVFVFIPPHERNKNFIKRIVAVEGDTVKTQGDTLSVNGKVIDGSNYAKYASYSVAYQQDFDFPPFRKPHYLPDGEAFTDYKLSRNQFRMKFPEGKPFEIPKGYVFAMGDNRDHSSDSRVWGPVSVTDIKGQAFMVYWSHDAFSRGKSWEVWKLVSNIRFSRIGRLIWSEFDRNKG
ncbi:MAG: signal peptidase I [Candidatus Poribacteria bacterium]|nr:signal peptidase I [Candidatus Poribacteria bacterium]